LAIDTNARRVYERWGFTPATGSAALNQAVMELGATVCRAHVARCPACPVTACASRGMKVVRPARRERVRFEDTDRYARGRVLAALAGRAPWPDFLGAERLDRALDRLAADGLVNRESGHTTLAQE
jgi:A/G-specific adenine glycosylase